MWLIYRVRLSTLIKKGMVYIANERGSCLVFGPRSGNFFFLKTSFKLNVRPVRRERWLFRKLSILGKTKGGICSKPKEDYRLICFLLFLCPRRDTSR